MEALPAAGFHAAPNLLIVALEKTMYGRFTVQLSPDEIGNLYDAAQPALPLDLPRRYNGAPTQDFAACRLDESGRRVIAMLRWVWCRRVQGRGNQFEDDQHQGGNGTRQAGLAQPWASLGPAIIGEDVTLKRYYRQDGYGRIELQPVSSNDEHNAIPIDGQSDFEISGVVVRAIIGTGRK